MDTYTVFRVQPTPTAKFQRYRGGLIRSYDTLGKARSFRTLKRNEFIKTHQDEGKHSWFRILHAHVDPNTLEVTTKWIDD